MKKLFVLLIVLILTVSLVACGEKTEKTPSGSENPGTSQTDVTPSGSESGNENVTDIDLSKILAGNGATDIIYSKLTAAQKQALIDDAKKDGVDVSFGADGSMTVKDSSNGTEVVQKPDGTWTVKSEDGEGQIGGNWPDNEFTKLVPKPDFTLTAANTTADGFSVTFSNATLEQMRDYAEKVKTKGFTIDSESEEQEVMGMAVFTYAASNTDGYRVEIVSAAGSSAITITK